MEIKAFINIFSVLSKVWYTLAILRRMKTAVLLTILSSKINIYSSKYLLKSLQPVKKGLAANQMVSLSLS